jgi:hypothetical protein
MPQGYSPFDPLKQQRYGDDRHPALPWGYWLVSTGPVAGEPPLVDEDGRKWDSVRQAFWEGRLGLPPIHYNWSNSILEFIASYLAILDHRFVAPEERVRDVFLGDAHLDTFFSAWMLAVGLVTERFGEPSVEGHAVLHMLIATRTAEDASEPVGLPWIEANRSGARSAERLATAELVQRREAVAAKMRHRFATDVISGLPVIKLIGLRITPEIPVRSTLWSMSWPDRDRHARDRFYLWLLERIDRWDDWSEMVTRDGARALTEHLMRLAFCDRFGAETGVSQ